MTGYVPSVLQVQVLLYRSLSLYLVLPWPNLPDSEQDWLNRAANHSTFVKQLSAQFVQLKDAKQLGENKLLQEQGEFLLVYAYALCILHNVVTV